MEGLGGERGGRALGSDLVLPCAVWGTPSPLTLNPLGWGGGVQNSSRTQGGGGGLKGDH